MHPIERLRYVARAVGADPALVAREAAGALAEMAADDPASLVPSCRRLIGRHLTSGPVWWLSARMLSSAEPERAAYQAAAELDHDRTASHLGRALPDDSTVLIVGWPDIIADALRRRGDLEVLVADAGGDGCALARRLEDAGTPATIVADAGVAAAATVADLVVVEAAAAGPSGLLATPGSHAAAAVGAHAGVPVWGVAGVGRVLPGPLWQALLARVDGSGIEPWERDAELVPAALLATMVGPDGPAETTPGLAQASCPPVAELLRDVH